MKTAFVLLLFTFTAAAFAGEPVAGIDGALAPAPGVIVTGRLEANDIDTLRGAGIRHVIDLTLDAETPDFDEATTVRAAGMRYANLPVRAAADLTLENARALDALLAKADRPLVVHCASGNRVGALVALRAAWVEGHSPEQAI